MVRRFPISLFTFTLLLSSGNVSARVTRSKKDINIIAGHLSVANITAETDFGLNDNNPEEQKLKVCINLLGNKNHRYV